MLELLATNLETVVGGACNLTNQRGVPLMVSPFVNGASTFTLAAGQPGTVPEGNFAVQHPDSRNGAIARGTCKGGENLYVRGDHSWPLSNPPRVYDHPTRNGLLF